MPSEDELGPDAGVGAVSIDAVGLGDELREPDDREVSKLVVGQAGRNDLLGGVPPGVVPW